MSHVESRRSALRRSALAAILCLGAAAGTGEARAGAPATDVEVARRIEALVRERLEAGARGDVVRWRHRVADDCAWIGVGLAVETTAGVAAAQVDVGGRREVEDFEARVHGDVVVATYLVVEQIGAAERARTVRIRKLDTYVRRDGDWWLIANAESLAPLPRTVVAVAPERLDRYVGEYAGRFTKPVTVRVWRDGSALMVQDSTSTSASELRPTSEQAFFVEGEPAEWAFELDAAGRASALLYRAGGAELRFERVRGPSPRP